HLILRISLLHSSPPQLYALSLHDALPISFTITPRPVLWGAESRWLSQLLFIIHLLFASLLLPSAGNSTTTTSPSINQLSNSQKRSEEHTSELQSPDHLVCRLLLEKKKNTT